MSKQEFSEGKTLRNFIRGTGKGMDYYVDLFDMTRQNINYHLRKDVLEPKFKLLVESKLKIDLDKEIFSKWKMNNPINAPDKHRWQDTSELAIKAEHLSGRSFEDIISRYKHDLTNPPMVKDEIVAYRTIVNSHSTPDILINVLYRLDNLEGK